MWTGPDQGGRLRTISPCAEYAQRPRRTAADTPARLRKPLLYPLSYGGPQGISIVSPPLYPSRAEGTTRIPSPVSAAGHPRACQASGNFRRRSASMGHEPRTRGPSMYRDRVVDLLRRCALPITLGALAACNPSAPPASPSPRPPTLSTVYRAALGISIPVPEGWSVDVYQGTSVTVESPPHAVTHGPRFTYERLEGTTPRRCVPGSMRWKALVTRGGADGGRRTRGELSVPVRAAHIHRPGMDGAGTRWLHNRHMADHVPRRGCRWSGPSLHLGARSLHGSGSGTPSRRYERH